MCLEDSDVSRANVVEAGFCKTRTDAADNFLERDAKHDPQVRMLVAERPGCRLFGSCDEP